MFSVSKEDEEQYVKDIALLHRVTMREQGRIPQGDITEEEDEISSNESDPEPDLKEAEEFFPHRVPKKSRLNQQTKNSEVILREYTTRSGRITSVIVPVGLQRDGKQIRKVRQQEHL